MDKKYAIVIGIILVVFLISSSYALLTNGNANSTKNTNDVTKDSNISVDKSVSVDNSSMDNSAGVSKSIALKSEINGVVPNFKVVSENPPADRIYRENGKLFFEGYDANGNKFVSEMPDLPNEHYADDGDSVVSDNSGDNFNPDDDPVMKNKKVYSQMNLTPETMVYI